MEHAIQAKMELVTPDRAAKLLERNTHNRPISKPYVRELRRELEEGRWKPTHQGVALSPDGTLVDGQHRLTAILESGIPATLLVAEGVAPDAFNCIDQIRKRTGGQILSMSGVSRDAPRMIAMARAILQVVYGNNKVSNTAAAEYAVSHQEHLERFLPVARQFTPAVAAAFAWCHSIGWGAEVVDAAERLTTSVWDVHQETDPMRALANRSREFGKLGAGQAGIKGRFDVALNCLQALHEGRGLRVARSYRPDYVSLEADSKAPGASLSVAPGRYDIPSMPALRNPTRIEYDGSEEPPNVLATEMTDEQAAKLEASLSKVSKRKSFLSPSDILGRVAKDGAE